MPPSLCERVVRVESDIADFDFAALRSVCLSRGLTRAVIVAKHPCGIGADLTIDWAARLKASENSQPSILGLVMATCCTNKLTQDDWHVSHVAEFCTFYSSSVSRPRTSSLQLATAKKSLLEPAASPLPQSPQLPIPPLERAVELMSRCSAWRTATHSFGSGIDPEQITWAERFEDGIQILRLRRLKTIFGDAVQVRFAPRECTMQDRCLIAGASSLPPSLLANGDDDDACFFASLQRGLDGLLAEGGPIDCRPKGLKSAKYEFDYTGDE